MMPVPGTAARRMTLPAPWRPVDVVMQRTGFAQRHADELALGLLGRLADRLGNFAGLAVAEADAALLVADDDERGEAEALAALHHLGDAVDVDQAVDKLAVALLNVSHCAFPLRDQNFRPASRAASARALTRPW